MQLKKKKLKKIIIKMGTAMNSVCASCMKNERDKRRESYFISETDTSAPQSIMDIKVNARNFVVQRNVNVYDVYEKLQFLGEGAFGSVFKVKRKNSSSMEIVRALKEIDKDVCVSEENQEEIRNEIEVLKNLDHPNIMKIYEFFEDEKKMYLISEFCGGGDVAGLNDKYGNFPEILVKYIMFQVFLAISFLHSNKVVHGDIKRENIAFVHTKEKGKNEIDEYFQKLFNNKEIQYELAEASGLENLSDKALSFIRELSNFDMKILDFGSAKMKKKGKQYEKLSGVTGTVYYCSPEVVKDKYDFECDEWACGVMMYILLTGYPPFQGNDEEEVFDNILNIKPNFQVPEFKNVTLDCIDLIKKLLEKDAGKRIKADEALKHDFFINGINIGNLLKGKYQENAKILQKLMKRKTFEARDKKRSKFRDVVIAYIALNFSSQIEQKEARQIFMDMAGGDKHFLIKKKTFTSKMGRLCKDLSEKEIEDLFDSIDENETGNIEYEELIRALADKEQLLSDKNLKEAFSFFDKDNNGTISWSEIAEIVYPEGKIPQNTIKEFLKEIGQKDENMEINFEDFKTILQQKK
jgi:calcium-dependent protein kinase